MGEDATETARQGGEVASGCYRDRKARRERAGGVEEGGGTIKRMENVINCAAFLRRKDIRNEERLVWHSVTYLHCTFITMSNTEVEPFSSLHFWA